MRRHIQAVNVEAALWLSQALTSATIEHGFGRIIFITSNTVWRPPAVAFLASDAAAAITGQTLCADGGPVFA
jgi:3-oxoacyl-[acyl-carrier protein] reductase